MTPLNPPAAVLDIARRLEDAGFQAWCVGGAIRDALLGHPHLDWDLATSATPEEVRRLFGKRTIPVGIEFGTVGVLDKAGTMHEVTTFRRDVKTDGRHAVVEFGASLDDDLARRDFTINAIAYSPREDEIRDPFDGRGDLARRVVRAVGDADARMREDRLRALRAIRFAARFDFSIDASTLRALEASAPYLGRLSAERVKQELDKTMEQVDCPSRALRLWRDTGAFATLIPSLAKASDEALSVPDFLARPGLERRPARRTLRMAGLLASLGHRDAVRQLERLKSSKIEIQTVGSLLESWESCGEAIAVALASGADRRPSDAQVRRWVAVITRTRVGLFMRLASAMWTAARTNGRPSPTTPAVRALHRRMLVVAFRDPLDLGSLAVDGDDLRRAGIPAGPELGKILRSLMTAVIDDPARNTTDWLLQEAKRLHTSGEGRGTS
jgi:tRNA nucleotidyltransferase (CCA-adding enzyme)